MEYHVTSQEPHPHPPAPQSGLRWGSANLIAYLAAPAWTMRRRSQNPVFAVRIHARLPPTIWTRRRCSQNPGLGGRILVPPPRGAKACLAKGSGVRRLRPCGCPSAPQELRPLEIPGMQAGYSSVGRASDCRLLQQSECPWFVPGWPEKGVDILVPVLAGISRQYRRALLNS